MIKANTKWKHVGTYVDDGFSGTNTEHRPAFQLMMKDAMAGKIDMIITKSVSRFARNLLDCIGWVRRLKEFDPPIQVFFEQLYVFDLTSTEIFLPAVKDPDNPKARAKRSAAMYPANWRDSFGIPVQEHDDSMQVDLMEGFNFADMGGKPEAPHEDQEQLPMEIIDKETGEVIKV